MAASSPEAGRGAWAVRAWGEDVVVSGEGAGASSSLRVIVPSRASRDERPSKRRRRESGSHPAAPSLGEGTAEAVRAVVDSFSGMEEVAVWVRREGAGELLAVSSRLSVRRLARVPLGYTSPPRLADGPSAVFVRGRALCVVEPQREGVWTLRHAAALPAAGCTVLRADRGGAALLLTPQGELLEADGRGGCAPAAAQPPSAPSWTSADAFGADGIAACSAESRRLVVVSRGDGRAAAALPLGRRPLRVRSLGARLVAVLAEDAAGRRVGAVYEVTPGGGGGGGGGAPVSAAAGQPCSLCGGDGTPARAAVRGTGATFVRVLAACARCADAGEWQTALARAEAGEPATPAAERPAASGDAPAAAPDAYARPIDRALRERVAAGAVAVERSRARLRRSSALLERVRGSLGGAPRDARPAADPAVPEGMVAVVRPAADDPRAEAAREANARAVRAALGLPLLEAPPAARGALALEGVEVLAAAAHCHSGASPARASAELLLRVVSRGRRGRRAAAGPRRLALELGPGAGASPDVSADSVTRAVAWPARAGELLRLSAAVTLRGVPPCSLAQGPPAPLELRVLVLGPGGETAAAAAVAAVPEGGGGRLEWSVAGAPPLAAAPLSAPSRAAAVLAWPAGSGGGGSGAFASAAFDDAAPLLGQPKADGGGAVVFRPRAGYEAEVVPGPVSAAVRVSAPTDGEAAEMLAQLRRALPSGGGWRADPGGTAAAEGELSRAVAAECGEAADFLRGLLSGDTRAADRAARWRDFCSSRYVGLALRSDRAAARLDSERW